MCNVYTDHICSYMHVFTFALGSGRGANNCDNSTNQLRFIFNGKPTVKMSLLVFFIAYEPCTLRAT